MPHPVFIRNHPDMILEKYVLFKPMVPAQLPCAWERGSVAGRGTQ